MTQSTTPFTNPFPSSPSSDPPDPNVNQMEEDIPHKPSYKEVVTDQSQERSTCYEEDFTTESEKTTNVDTKTSISLSKEEKHRIYSPWKHSVIIKCVGKKFNHNYLKIKLTDLWKFVEKLTQIDLGDEFFTVKLGLEESQKKILHLGPWFVAGSYISTRKWESNFVPYLSKIPFTAIWIRLPFLPIEFYDRSIHERIGKQISSLLKINTCTYATLRGRFARICVQIPLDTPVCTSILIGTHSQPIYYEGEGILCTGCGRLGHVLRHCDFKVKENPQEEQPKAEEQTFKESA
ncbi:uncharacterized protein LOC107865107 [Capsicum annuum]|uniref:uncharacterized protein LOC107865107 n=1 Tax=Capsicum annuum TaxID=4072 RepID=UPI0007BFC4D8|nr:uncharacterized protein LOC107865107 [Capsicum annuum]